MERFNKIISLFRRLWQGKLSAEEQQEVTNMLDDPYMCRVHERLSQKGFIAGRLEEYGNYDPVRAYGNFRGRVRKKRVWIRWGTGAAAAIVVIISCTWLLKMNSIQPEVAPVIPAVKDEVIKPGRKKALLRLADGSMVNISGDSMKIKEQKGATINYNNGNISYHSTMQTAELVYNELVVPVAGECYITLDDGTRVWMNADSRLKYPLKFIGEERKVFLEGEAYFEVMHGEKPFIVSTRKGDVRVLGTSFDVKAYKDEENVYTTLVTGRVRFTAGKDIEIGPGEQVVAGKDGFLEKRRVNLDEYIGWRNGMYVFRDQTLESIMNDLARWYNVSVFYQNPELKKVAFTGNLKRYDYINSFMEILERTGEINYKITKNTIILYK